MLPTKQILCVEDDEDTCFMLTQLFKTLNYEVSTATTVQNALEVVQKKSFNLYILDARFGGESGTSLCRQVRELHPSAPIIVYSGAVFDSDQQAALDAGADAFVPKPRIDKLLETVQQLLDDG